jgi:hypothetical protein
MIHVVYLPACRDLQTNTCMIVRQKNGRSSHPIRGQEQPNSMSPRRKPPFSTDLSGVLPRNDVTGSDLSDLSLPLLDAASLPHFDDSDAYDWNKNAHFSCNGDYEAARTPEDMITGQLMSLSSRTMRATRELEHSGSTALLTVNSPVVNEAFEVANALVRIVNTISPSDPTCTSLQPLAHEDNEKQHTIDYGSVFLALAFHQHVLALFRAICDSIQRSLGSIGPIIEQQQQALHGNSASSAQFVMVLQLVMHMVNRIGRSLRIGNRDTTRAVTITHPQNSAFGLDSARDENTDSQSIVDMAQEIIRGLGDEHGKIKRTIQSLQSCMEDGMC